MHMCVCVCENSAYFLVWISVLPQEQNLSLLETTHNSSLTPLRWRSRCLTFGHQPMPISLTSHSQDAASLGALFPLCHLRVWESCCSFLGVKKSPTFSFASWGSVQKAGLVPPYTTKVSLPIPPLCPFTRCMETSALFEAGVQEALFLLMERLSILGVSIYGSAHIFGHQNKTPLIFLSPLAHPFLSDTDIQKRQHHEWRRGLGGELRGGW